MESQQVIDRSPSPQPAVPVPEAPAAAAAAAEGQNPSAAKEEASLFTASGLASWARNLKIPQAAAEEDGHGGAGNGGKSAFSRFTSGLGLRTSPKASQQQEETAEGTSTAAGAAAVQPGVLGSLTRGLVDSSKSAVKAVQVKARHIVSQNKRRYQEGGFDLDMTYITENIIAMGFPAGDMSSGFFGYVEGFYRNHMEEVIKFFESHHTGKYKVYNLCSERLYDASLLEGKVACFPFDDHNCPPIHLITLFCQSAYSWLKEDIENVVVVHCKAGMARTGLMISSLLLYLKFFPTAEESIDYYNQKRCVDGKGLVLPSQIRYVKYFERILTYFNGENLPGRRCMLRGFRLHRCPYWIRPSITISNHNGVLFSTKKHPRTKDLLPEDFWFSAPKKGIMVFALPGEPGLTELAGDFKITFHDRQGDFYCWLNTTMMENRKILNTADLDAFDKRKLPSPGFQVEVVLADHNASQPPKPAPAADAQKEPGGDPATTASGTPSTDGSKQRGNQEKDEVFSDDESEESGSSRGRRTLASVASSDSAAAASASASAARTMENKAPVVDARTLASGVEQVSLNADKVTSSAEPRTSTTEANGKSTPVPKDATKPDPGEVSEFKAIAADASVFSFGDEDEYESE